MRIEIAIYEGYDEVDAIGPFEVLRNADLAVEDLDVVLVGALGAGEVVAGHGLRTVVDETLSDAADLVVVPGGGWSSHLPGAKGARAAYDAGEIPARLAELHAAGTTIASVCTGAFLLGKAGLLQGRPATTHRGNLDALAGEGALVDRESRVVDDGDVLTCGGVTSGLDLALHVVQTRWGAELADGIAELMEHERRGPVRVTA